MNVEVTPPAPLQVFGLRIEVNEDDRPEDKFSHHVNNARYFAFINRTLQAWYVPMGLRGTLPDCSAPMVHCEYDFAREVLVPGAVYCRLSTARVGTKSIEHNIQIWDLAHSPPRLAGRGRSVHVCIQRSSRSSRPWPAEVLALCWNGVAQTLSTDHLEVDALQADLQRPAALDLSMLAERANGDAQLARWGRALSTRFLLAADSQSWLIDIHEGRVAQVRGGPFVMPGWDFALRAPASEWRAFWEPRPRPGHHDLFALLKRRVLRVEGNLQPFMSHLFYFKALLATLRPLP